MWAITASIRSERSLNLLFSVIQVDLNLADTSLSGALEHESLKTVLIAHKNENSIFA